MSWPTAAWRRRIDRAWRRLGARRQLAAVLVGFISFGLSAAISSVRIPVPRMHDEFSYLLAADTFAGGRLANPMHPLRKHFETFHVLQEPTYASKYPPSQGLFLALGERLGGHPIVGVWLTTALAAAACCWMLQGWVPGRFALLGGVIVAFHHGLQFYWQNYWNGSVALMGGALLFGAAARLWRRPRLPATLAMVLGIALLANSRPYSGLVASLPVIALLAVRFLGRRRPPPATSLGHVIVPAALLLLLVGGWMAFYNARLTGDPMTLPYQAHSQRYAYTPVFLWQKPRPAPEYPNQAFRDFYLGWQAEGYLEQQSLAEAFGRKRGNLYFYAPPLLLIPLLTLPWMLRSRRTRFAAGTVLLVFAASLGVSGTHAHYIAPVAPLIFLLVVQGLRQVNLFAWRGRVVGPALVAALLLLHLAIFAAAIPLYAAQEVPAWSLQRDRIRAELEGTPDRHLVVVEYAAGHSPHEEWVANEADIDGAKIVWARSLGRVADSELAEYFADRRVWTLRPDSVEPTLIALTPGVPGRTGESAVRPTP